MINPVIVALDGMSSEKALELAETLKGQVAGFKANDLLDLAGPTTAIKTLRRYGIVMADPKLHDIPNTVRNRTAIYANAGTNILTVQASGGIEMMRAAVATAEEVYHKNKNLPWTSIAAVTVLTSLNEEECQINLGGPVKAKVLQYARNAVLAGVDNIVCSAKELEFLNKFPELNLLAKITPGITPEWANKSVDQKRITTPTTAIKNDASFLVIGRAITKPPEGMTSLDAVQRILTEVETAEEMKSDE